MKLPTLYKFRKFFTSVDILRNGSIVTSRYAQEAQALKKVMNPSEITLISKAVDTEAFQDILQLIVIKQATSEKKAEFRDYPRHLRKLLKELCNVQKKAYNEINNP